jgi:hypothetical protein
MAIYMWSFIKYFSRSGMAGMSPKKNLATLLNSKTLGKNPGPNLPS